MSKAIEFVITRYEELWADDDMARDARHDLEALLAEATKLKAGWENDYAYLSRRLAQYESVVRQAEEVIAYFMVNSHLCYCGASRPSQPHREGCLCLNLLASIDSLLDEEGK